jgi:hypothetical protein
VPSLLFHEVPEVGFWRRRVSQLYLAGDEWI